MMKSQYSELQLLELARCICPFLPHLDHVSTKNFTYHLIFGMNMTRQSNRYDAHAL